MKSKLYIAVAFLLVTAFQSRAITVSAVLDSIMQNNVELKVAKAKTDSKIAEIKSTNNLGDTEVEFEYQKGDNIDGNKYGFAVSQGFEWFGMYGARSKANKSYTKAAQYEYLSQVLNVKLSAEQLCLKIISANRKIKAQTEVYNNIKQLYDEYQKGFEHGEISILDINKLKIELLNVKRAKESVTVERNALIEELTALNGNKSIQGLTAMDEYPVQQLKSSDVYESQIAEVDPEFNSTKAGLEGVEKEVSMAKMGWLPKFSVGYKYANELGDRFNGVSVGMALPIFSNRNKVSVAKANQVAETYSQMNTSIEKTSQMKSDYSKAVALQEQIKEYSAVLGDSSNKEMLKKALNGGQITLLDYLLELRYFLEAQQELLDLEFEYNSMVADLNKYELL